MSGGWSANGNTHPNWRHCPHRSENGKCVDCRAVHVDYVPERYPSRTVGATPLGSVYVIPPKYGDLTMLRAGPNGLAAKEWNGSIRRER